MVFVRAKVFKRRIRVECSVVFTKLLYHGPTSNMYIEMAKLSVYAVASFASQSKIYVSATHLVSRTTLQSNQLSISRKC